MFQLTEQLPFLDSLIDYATLDQDLAIDPSLLDKLSQKAVTSAEIVNQTLKSGKGVPVFYNCLPEEGRTELQQRRFGYAIHVSDGQVKLLKYSLKIQLIDYQFSFIHNDAFKQRNLIQQGFLSFDDRNRIQLDPENNLIGVWTTSVHIDDDFAKNVTLISAINAYIQSKHKKVTFTKKASFLLINFSINPTCFLISVDQLQEQILHSIEESLIAPKPKSTKLKLWENFLSKNSVGTELHNSLNDVERLEQQINTLSSDFAEIMEILKSTELVESHSHYHKLLRQSSQKLFTGRSHVDTRCGYQLSVGQLSEQSFYNDVPLINQI